ncbi:hypothetical protein E2562_009870 [Oryza meyeriana var. granulata]|uniref:Transcription repressor n=1 Tax=Oryza meyeriana var. granulata TaxID=110450 RepID=A0A6G1BTL5_9ORYZ|nr:hypothetical protein E2562_009870 [Oryza meyeriana var. granulata]
MSPGAAAKMRLGGGGGGGGFTLGCGCRDAKAVAVAASASSPCSAATESSTATTATWRRARTHPLASASASTGTLTVPSASSSFLWDDAEAEVDGEEVDCKRESSATMPSFSGLLRQLNELEQSVMSWGWKSPRRGNPLPPPPPPLPPPLLPLRPVQHRVVDGGGKGSNKEVDGKFSPPPPSSHCPATQQHRKVEGVDQRNREHGEAHLAPPAPPPLPLPPPPQQPRNVKRVDKGSNKEDCKNLPPPEPPKHRKAKSCDNDGFTTGKLDGSLAVVKQSEDPLGDFRRSMLNMIVENRIVTGDELRELLRRFLELNAPHHHDAILRAFAEIWDEVFAAPAEPPVDPPRPLPRQRTPPRRRHPPPAWRL